MTDFDPRARLTWADIAVLAFVAILLGLGLISLIGMAVRWLA